MPKPMICNWFGAKANARPCGMEVKPPAAMITPIRYAAPTSPPFKQD